MSDQRKSQLDALAIVLLLGCCAIWGLNQVSVKIALQEMPPLLQAGVRSLGAALLVVGWARFRGLRLLDADGTGAAGLLAGSLFAAEFGLYFIGLQFTSTSRMVVFLYTSPFVVALGMPFIARSERLGAAQLLGLVVAFGGVVWAFAEGFAGPAVGPRQWLGDALGLTGALLWGLTTLVLRGSRLSTALPEKALLYQLAVSAVALWVASAVGGETWPNPPMLSAGTWLALGFQVGVVTFASYLVWFWLIRHYAATRLAVFTLLTPVVGLLAGVMLLNEPLTLRIVCALIAVCTGIWLVNRPPQRTLVTPQGGSVSNVR